MASSVSVVIPTYNRVNYIARAIRSALAQCVDGDEVIVVDDGSTDQTFAAVAAFGDMVRYIKVPNGGAGRARNIGLDVAAGDYIAFLDSDDEWFDHKLRMQRELLDARDDVLFTFSNFAITRDDGTAERRFLEKWLTQSQTWEDSIGPAEPLSRSIDLPPSVDDFSIHVGDMAAAQLVDNFVLTSSLLVRRIEAGAALRFAEDLAIGEDWYCFARLALVGKGAYLDCETAWQHGMAEERVSSADNLVRAICREKMNERIWERDGDFKNRHAELYTRTVHRNRMELARTLLGAGRTAEARGVLKKIDGAAPLYRALSYAPGRLVRWIGAAKTKLAT